MFGVFLCPHESRKPSEFGSLTAVRDKMLPPRSWTCFQDEPPRVSKKTLTFLNKNKFGSLV